MFVAWFVHSSEQKQAYDTSPVKQELVTNPNFLESKEGKYHATCSADGSPKQDGDKSDVDDPDLIGIYPFIPETWEEAHMFDYKPWAMENPVFDPENPFADKWNKDADDCCEEHPGWGEPSYTYYVDCDNDEKDTRLKWAIRYMRSASNSPQFEECLRSAVHDRYSISGVSDEHEWVGPYVPCFEGCGTSDLRDPCYIRSAGHPENVGYDVVMGVLRQSGHKYRRVKFYCDAPISSTMRSPPGDSAGADRFRWDYQDTGMETTKYHVLEVNRYVFDEYPGHFTSAEEAAALATYYLYADIFGSCRYEECYPIDEMSGIIAHEILHVSPLCMQKRDMMLA